MKNIFCIISLVACNTQGGFHSIILVSSKLMASLSKRIIVLGPSKMGKTSVVNALMEMQCKDNSIINVCNTSLYSSKKIQRSSVVYELIDLVGLSTLDMNNINEEEMCKYFDQMLEHARNGLSLIIFVLRNGTIHQTSADMYNLFVNILCEKRLPVLGVITCCENEEPIWAYAEKNRDHYARNGMKFTALVSTCFGRGGPLEVVFQELREESIERVWQMIELHSLKENISVTPKRCQSMNVLQQSQTKSLWEHLWNGFNKWREEKNQIYQNLQARASGASSQIQMKATHGHANTSLSVAVVHISNETNSDNEMFRQNTQTYQQSSASGSSVQLKFTGDGAYSYEKYKQILDKWFASKYSQLHLIYKATKDGFSARAFHTQCDEKGPTVTLIQVPRGYLFGGYTQISWSSQFSRQTRS